MTHTGLVVDQSQIAVVEVEENSINLIVTENSVVVETSEVGPQGPPGPEGPASTIPGPQGPQGPPGQDGAGIATVDAPLNLVGANLSLDYDPLTLDIGPSGLTVIGGSFSGDADTLDGHDSTYFIDTSSSTQTKSGSLTLGGTGTMEVLDLNETSITSSLVTIPVTTPVLIDAFSASLYRSAEYILQLSQGASYSISKFLLIHNGADVAITEYGQVSIGDHIPYEFSASFALDNLEVTIQCIDANVTPVDFKFSRVLFDA